MATDSETQNPGRELTKDPSKIKRCPECRRLVAASTMRPLSRTRYGGGIRYACPDCFQRVTALRKATPAARAKPSS